MNNNKLKIKKILAYFLLFKHLERWLEKYSLSMKLACFPLNLFGNTFNIIFVSFYESSLIRETLSK